VAESLSYRYRKIKLLEMSELRDSEKDKNVMTESEEETTSRKGTDPEGELPADPHSRISELEEALTTEKDKHLRLFAEFDNFKKRNVRDRIELLKYANEEVITSLLPVVDDLERARDAGQLPDGVTLIYQKLVNTLEQKGLKPMVAVGKEFDPELHDAMSQVAVEEKSKKNMVVDEIEKGYYLNDKVIRHARVVVGK
jgi:molecular chaperone GrpE